MNPSFSKLTVYFEEPFWVGVFERVSDGKLSACKITFGAEPKDYEVWAFVLKHYDALKFSPGVDAERRQTPDNPKRRQREARKQTQSHAVGTKAKTSAIGTKSQQALQLQREAMKTERKRVTKEEREAEERRQFEMKRQKRKEKHKGR